MAAYTDRHTNKVAIAVDLLAAAIIAIFGAVLIVLAYISLAIGVTFSIFKSRAGRARGFFAFLWRWFVWVLVAILYGVYWVLAGIAEYVSTRLSKLDPIEKGEERRPANETYHTDLISSELLNRIRRDYRRGNTRRDAHPKQHGCVRGIFAVNDDLDADLAVGIFSKTTPNKYDAWVRLSNSSHVAQEDSAPDVRGIAIKLCDALDPDVGQRNPFPSGHQDILLISERVFPVHTVAQFSYVVRALLNPLSLSPLYLVYALIAPWRWYIIRNLLLIRLRRHKSLLNLTYHSVTPYLFGDGRAVKYALIPRETAPLDQEQTTDFLRHDLRQRLQNGSVIFDFCVQVQTDAYRMPVERPGIAWPEKLSPFLPVATLSLPPQIFDTDKQTYNCENMTYTPWNALPEHTPIGGINRARELVYKRISSFRHERNEVKRSEPSCAELDKCWRHANS